MSSTASEIVKSCSIPDNKKYSCKVVANVTVCLASTHDECMGIYRDTISGTYVIKCLCKCHESERVLHNAC